MWTSADVSFEIVADVTDDPVVTASIFTPVGEILVMAEVAEDGSNAVSSGPAYALGSTQYAGAVEPENVGAGRDGKDELRCHRD
jgi:hypothetical protein